MSDWYYFWRGLAGAFSWEKGQDNALIGGAPSWTYLLGLSIHFLVIVLRSEERRVGKECRSRWSPYH